MGDAERDRLRRSASGQGERTRKTDLGARGGATQRLARGPAEPVSGPPTPEEATKRLLVAHGDPDTLVWMRRRFAHPDLWLEVAVNGVEALAGARRIRPHVIVLDPDLPVVDGYQVFRSLRKSAELATAHLILVGASAPAGALALAKDFGAYACFGAGYSERKAELKIWEALRLRPLIPPSEDRGNP